MPMASSGSTTAARLRACRAVLRGAYLEGTTKGLNFYQLDTGGGDETTAMRLETASAAGGSGRLVQSSSHGSARIRVRV